MEEIKLDSYPVKNSPQNLESGNNSQTRSDDINQPQQTHCTIFWHFFFFLTIILFGGGTILLLSELLNTHVNYKFDKYNCTVDSIRIDGDKIYWDVTTTEGWGSYVQKKTKSPDKYIEKYQINSTYTCYWDDKSEYPKLSWNQYYPTPGLTVVISICLITIILAMFAAIVFWIWLHGCFKKLMNKKKTLHYNEMHDEL